MLVPTLLWTNATNLTLRNHFSWGGAPLPNSFARLPLSAEATVRSPVWSLSTDAAGRYVEGDQLFDSVPKGPLWQPTEAGTHPSDLGMASMAEFWIRYLRRLLSIP